MIALDNCPRRSFHTKAPTGYVAWHVWAEKKARRHYQIKCDGCGRFAVWKRKPLGITTEDTE